ncbi:MAG TPA: GGDEF domain-containing protein, partial [candidate division Zixibacteria bacterium]|nr:GGDEF domain-containing protein [candidate division Zixibacteria bacterium]
SLGVIMLEIDNLRDFDGNFSSEAGATILRTVADFLSRHTRKEDIASRYGDNEFVLILMDATLDLTLQRAEKLREEIKALRVPSGQPINISAGVASFPDHGRTPDTLLEAADSALLTARSGGRDQVSVALSG